MLAMNYKWKVVNKSRSDDAAFVHFLGD